MQSFFRELQSNGPPLSKLHDFLFLHIACSVVSDQYKEEIDSAKIFYNISSQNTNCRYLRIFILLYRQFLIYL